MFSIDNHGHCFQSIATAMPYHFDWFTQMSSHFFPERAFFVCAPFFCFFLFFLFSFFFFFLVVLVDGCHCCERFKNPCEGGAPWMVAAHHWPGSCCWFGSCPPIVAAHLARHDDGISGRGGFTSFWKAKCNVFLFLLFFSSNVFLFF